MMNLAIDIGNTLAKMAVIENGQIVDTFKSECVDCEYVSAIFDSYPMINGAIMIAASDEYVAIEEFVEGRVSRFIKFTHQTPVPLNNLYGTPMSLGCDRMAAAVGANALYPDSNVLIVDFGTAITIDMVSSKNEYLGGNISPGAATRFRALNYYTKRLPLCELTEQTTMIGKSSIEAIQSGVIEGIVYEVEGYILRLSQKYDNLRIIFTGGDGNFFAKRLKNPIFATYDLVVYGLNRILEYNAD